MKKRGGVVKILFLATILFLGTGQFSRAQNSSRQGKLGWEDGILHFRSNDGQFMLRFDTRGYIDFARYNDNKNPLSSGADIRRGRFAMKTTLWNVWQAEFDIDVGDNQIEMKDMKLGYNLYENGIIWVGNFKPPYSLEELTTSRYISFLERAYPNAFTPGRRIGISYSTWGKNWYFSTDYFGQPAEDPGKKTVDETWGVAARATVAPICRKGRVLHLGLSGYSHAPDDNQHEVKFDYRPETKVSRIKFLDTGNINHVKNVLAYGLEGATVFGPVSLQAEYMGTKLSRMNGLNDLSFKGGYAFVSCFLTGESRFYDSSVGEFGLVVPKHKYGAWELLVRYSHLDLDDVSAKDANNWVKGGRANNYTIGLNWYANPNVRIMMNYIFVNNSNWADGKRKYKGDDDFSFFTMRFLYYF